MKHLKRGFVCTAAAALLLTGCSSGPNGPGSTETASGDVLDAESVGTAPISNVLSATQACMEEQGLVANYDGRGGLKSGSQAPEQGELWKEIYTECGEEAGLFDPMTESQLKELYALEVANHRCLLDHGYESGDPPTEQSFVDGWMQGDIPYQSVEAVAADRKVKVFLEATQVCPAPLWSFG